MTIVTVFRSRLRAGVEDAYEPVSIAMSRIASSMDGFVDQKSYVAPDGERVTIVRFRDEESQLAWRRHPEHVAAQKRGRAELYSWYDISVGEERHGHVFESPDGSFVESETRT
jgi:heme-degrading monooxygenase HmoA